MDVSACPVAFRTSPSDGIPGNRSPSWWRCAFFLIIEITTTKEDASSPIPPRTFQCWASTSEEGRDMITAGFVCDENDDDGGDIDRNRGGGACPSSLERADVSQWRSSHVHTTVDAAWLQAFIGWSESVFVDCILPKWRRTFDVFFQTVSDGKKEEWAVHVLEELKAVCPLLSLEGDVLPQSLWQGWCFGSSNHRGGTTRNSTSNNSSDDVEYPLSLGVLCPYVDTTNSNSNNSNSNSNTNINNNNNDNDNNNNTITFVFSPTHFYSLGKAQSVCRSQFHTLVATTNSRHFETVLANLWPSSVATPTTSTTSSTTSSSSSSSSVSSSSIPGPSSHEDMLRVTTTSSSPLTLITSLLKEYAHHGGAAPFFVGLRVALETEMESRRTHKRRTGTSQCGHVSWSVCDEVFIHGTGDAIVRGNGPVFMTGAISALRGLGFRPSPVHGDDGGADEDDSSGSNRAAGTRGRDGNLRDWSFDTGGGGGGGVDGKTAVVCVSDSELQSCVKQLVRGTKKMHARATGKVTVVVRVPSTKRSEDYDVDGPVPAQQSGTGIDEGSAFLPSRSRRSRRKGYFSCCGDW
eukprot:TRINITY_DN2474_c0_g1_i1.p1 TRINITY_DN2474_c0_g1~~TRINITY_DN2474_c0_g1_i1.p1  ORF type:complete len:576 (+),score=158.52 TRINITY_DN2474_c0_g1_i1:39-1766(+)